MNARDQIETAEGRRVLFSEWFDYINQQEWVYTGDTSGSFHHGDDFTTTNVERGRERVPINSTLELTLD